MPTDPTSLSAGLSRVGTERLRPHRMDKDGKAYVLEANPNPQIARGEDFAESAKRAGLSYEALLQRIVMLGLQWRPAQV